MLSLQSHWLLRTVKKFCPETTAITSFKISYEVYIISPYIITINCLIFISIFNISLYLYITYTSISLFFVRIKPSEILGVMSLNLIIKVTLIDNLPDCTFFVSRFIYFAMENHSLPLSRCPDLLT